MDDLLYPLFLYCSRWTQIPNPLTFLPSILPPELLISHSNPNIINPILQEVEVQRDDEDTSELIHSAGSQPYVYNEGDLDGINSVEDDIEIIDDEQDKNLLQWVDTYDWKLYY